MLLIDVVAHEVSSVSKRSVCCSSSPASCHFSRHFCEDDFSMGAGREARVNRRLPFGIVVFEDTREGDDQSEIAPPRDRQASAGIPRWSRVKRPSGTSRHTPSSIGRANSMARGESNDGPSSRLRYGESALPLTHNLRSFVPEYSSLPGDCEDPS